MEEIKFKAWMRERGYTPGVVSTQSSRCRRIEKVLHVNLDVVFAQGEPDSLLEKFVYSAEDERNHKPTLHGIPIKGRQYEGTTALQSALKLYFDFKSEQNGIEQSPFVKTRNERVMTQRTIVGDTTQRPANIQQSGPTNPIDSYQLFCDDFHITPEELYRFGIRRSIFATPEAAWNQWQSLKKALRGERELRIRKYGRSAVNPFIEMYKHIFPQAQILEDSTGNAAPRAIIQRITNHTINSTICNFEVSHVFGYTKNPLLFNAAWNFFFCPRLIDPFTGHASTGRWPEEYQPLLREAVLTKFARCISDYNRMLAEEGIHDQIENYLANLNWGTEKTKELARFKEDVRKEWRPIAETE